MMHKYNKILQISVILLLLCMLTGGIAHLFSLRFSQGDLYPRYSSLRADPFGCKALYDSFNELDIKTTRHFDTVERLPEREKTLFIRTGISSMQDITNEPAIHHFIFNGGRFIGFFDPDAEGATKTETGEAKEIDTPSENTADEKEKSDEAEKIKSDSTPEESKELEFTGEKGCQINFQDSIHCELRTIYGKHDTVDIEYIGQPDEKFNTTGAFKSFPLCTTNFFELHDDKWKTLYRSQDGPVIIQRKIGKGDIILCSTSYFISNEGLRKHRNAPLLCYLQGGKDNIIFDEYFLGVQEERNIAWLFKKYKLQYMLLNLGIIVLFFLWYNFFSISGITAPKENNYLEASCTVESSLSSSSGLESILSKTIKPDQLLQVCFDEWLKTIKTRNISACKIEALKKIFKDSNKTTPVSLYREINKVLTKKELTETQSSVDLKE